MIILLFLNLFLEFIFELISPIYCAHLFLEYLNLWILFFVLFFLTCYIFHDLWTAGGKTPSTGLLSLYIFILLYYVVFILFLFITHLFHLCVLLCMDSGWQDPVHGPDVVVHIYFVYCIYLIVLFYLFIYLLYDLLYLFTL